MMKVTFLDLHKQYASIKKEVDAAVLQVMNNQSFILGDEVLQFEKEYATYLGVKYFVGVASGTDGLILALRSLGIEKGDEVITPVNSFVATALAITQVDATPVFVDIDPDTYQIDVEEVKKKITKKTKAIMPVHLYGAPCNIEELKQIADRESIYLVEDAAQAHGAKMNGRRVGGFGNVGVFSFYPGKNLGAYGDGGGISTNDEELYQKLLKLRNYGQSKKYYHDSIGVNSRLDEIQAAVLRVKLRHLDKWNAARKEHAAAYNQLLEGHKTQKLYPGSESAYHLFVMEHDERDKIQTYLQEKGIFTLIHYPLPIYMQKCYKYLGHKEGDFPKADKSAKQIFSLPMYTELSRLEIEYVAKTISDYPQL